MSYYEEGFGVVELLNNVKDCEDGDPEEYFKKIDFESLKEESDKFGVVNAGKKIKGIKDGVKLSVNVRIKKGENEPNLILTAIGTQNGKLYIGLNRNLKRDVDYVIDKKLFGQTDVTKINSDTPFEEVEETDGVTKYLVKKWDNNFDYQGTNQVSLSGLVVKAKANGGYGENIEGADVSVQYANEETVLKSCETVSGKYIIGDLEPGLYKLTVKKAGYLEATQYLYLNGMSDQYQNMTIALIKGTDSKGGLRGIIRDSVNLEGVSNLSLKLRKGFNNTDDGEVVKSVDTKSDGSYSFNELEAGYYCIEIHDKNGIYIDTALNVIVMGNSVISIQDGIVSKVLWKNQLRIVLTWNNRVRDLDSHVYGISEYFHVYYRNYQYKNSKGELKAKLDVDDTNYYGPETVTVYDPDISFLYYVHNYSGGGGAVLSNSEATVHVYTGNRLIDIYHVPSGNGYIWNVFSYNGNTGMIIPSNKIQ